jgi:hypothetical protein
VKKVTMLAYLKSRLSELKLRLSTLSTNSWHAYLTGFGWPTFFPDTKKACLYWWVVVPASLPIAGVKAVCFVLAWSIGLVLGAAVILLWPLGMLVGVLLGYKPRHWLLHRLVFDNEADNIIWAREHGKSSPRVRTRLRPIYVVLPLAVLASLVVYRGPVTGAVGGTWKYDLYGVASLAGLCLIGLGYQRWLAPFLKKICPDIVWVDPKEETA